MEEFTKEEYENALIQKEEIRKEILNIRFQIEINKFNKEELKILKEREKELINSMKKNIYIICAYEMDNNIERRKNK